jgi:hypothetical protein
VAGYWASGGLEKKKINLELHDFLFISSIRKADSSVTQLVTCSF